MDIKLERPIVFIDLETTGTETFSDRVVELFALKINPDKTDEFIATRINPEVSIPPEAIAVHGITDNDVIGKPNFKEYAPHLLDFLKDCDIAGYNVRRFDLEMLEAEFRRANIEFSREGRYIIDVQSIYHKFHPRDLAAAHKQYIDKEMEGHHSSEHDARATLEVFKAQLKTHAELPRTVKELHDFTSERRSLNWIDRNGKFVWVENEATVNFSKYRGKSLQYMAKNERDFLEWMIKNDFSQDAKNIASDALNGKLLKRSV